jgi:RNA:NAD 2'-phosphotransferase (TPT1/KptA family)
VVHLAERYAFRHELLAEVMHQGLLPGQRKWLHVV